MCVHAYMCVVHACVNNAYLFLCRNGAVRYESVMRLRMKLDELGKMEGVTTSEKGVSSHARDDYGILFLTKYFLSTDPEEFLTMLFKHALPVEPFIIIKCVLFVCVCVCVHACMHACVGTYVHVCVHMCVCLSVCACVHAYMHVCACTHDCFTACMCVFAHGVIFFHRRPFGTETEFFVQLFMEFDESLKNPTIQNLLQKMFREQQISFASVCHVLSLPHSISPLFFLLPPPDLPFSPLRPHPSCWYRSRGMGNSSRPTRGSFLESHWTLALSWSHPVRRMDTHPHTHTHTHAHTHTHTHTHAHTFYCPVGGEITLYFVCTYYSRYMLHLWQHGPQ